MVGASLAIPTRRLWEGPARMAGPVLGSRRSRHRAATESGQDGIREYAPPPRGDAALGGGRRAHGSGAPSTGSTSRSTSGGRQRISALGETPLARGKACGRTPRSYAAAVPHFVETFSVRTREHDQIVDITREVQRILEESRVREGQLVVYTPHATAAIAINENDDPNIGVDLLRALGTLVPPHDGWLHDRIDNNAASHIKSAIVGPSESIPIVEGRMTLGTWQNVFLCEFDGPRAERRVVVSIVS